ncbi:MAG: STT3 domain-containing protein, partial [Candidatus Micrarchaeota archaeon]
MFLELLAVLTIIIVMALPGILLSFALLRGVRLNFADKSIIGLILGITVNSMLSFLELLFLGIKFSSAAPIINGLIIIAFSLAVMFLQGQIRINFSNIGKYASGEFYRKKIEEKPISVGVYLFLIILMLAAFYARFATAASPQFFEFDPYYYDKVTEKLVLTGDMPLQSDDAYYPRFRSYRELPMIHFMTGSWYSLYRDITSAQYSQEQMVSIIQVYPPLMGMMMVFLAFLFVREESDKYLGLIAAAMFAFTPQLIKKLGAGVSEQAPFGMFAAIFLFAIYALAIKRKSLRLGLLTAFAAAVAMLGSGHGMWAVTILASFIFLASILEYLVGEFDKRTFYINAMITVSTVLAGYFYILFRNLAFDIRSFGIGTLFLLVALSPSVLFFLMNRFGIDKKLPKWKVFGVMLVMLLVVLSLVGGIALSYLNVLLGYAKADTPLNRTIQEENATSEALFASSFGSLNPNTLLIISTAILVALAVLALKRKSATLAAGYGAAAFIVIALNSYLDVMISLIAGFFSTSAPQITRLLTFFMDGDVFIYLSISVLSAMIYYYYEESKNKMTLLFLLVFFPTAYIGLNKVKYLLHLAFAVALALPFVLMIFAEFIEKLNSSFKLVADKNTVRMGMLIFVGLIGIVAAYKQFETVGQSMAELQYSRITPDWVDATKWMRENLGQDYRVSSWWDYGHWTNFFGGTKTVLDPSNYFGFYDQLTAQGYVDGNTSKLIDILHYHKATHVLVDSELVSKWGALVYLSSTFSDLPEPDTQRFNHPPANPSNTSPGASQYET